MQCVKSNTCKSYRSQVLSPFFIPPLSIFCSPVSHSYHQTFANVFVEVLGLWQIGAIIA